MEVGGHVCARSRDHEKVGPDHLGTEPAKAARLMMRVVPFAPE